MRKEPADFRDIALQNEKLVIRLLRRHGTLSQTQLRRLSGMSMSTSSYVISRLRNKGYVLEKKGESTKRGAKPVNLAINPLGCFAVGVEIKTQSVYAGVFDFNAELIAEAAEPITSTHPEIIADAVKRIVSRLTSENPLAQGKIRGVAAAVSGSIKDNSLVVLSSPLGWENVPFGEILAEKLDAAVTICTTQVRMLAEMDIEAPEQNVVYINIGNGVGGHIILDGHLCSGATGRIGELGHITVEPGGEKCGCGNKGCLETVISGRAIAKQIKSDIQKNKCHALKGQITEEDLPETIVEKWGVRLRNKDPYSITLAEQTAGKLSKVVCDMVNICDPQTLTLAGYVSDVCFDFLKKRLLTDFKTNVYNYSARNLEIKKAKCGHKALIKGAAISLLQ